MSVTRGFRLMLRFVVLETRQPTPSILRSVKKCVGLISGQENSAIYFLAIRALRAGKFFFLPCRFVTRKWFIASLTFV